MLPSRRLELPLTDLRCHPSAVAGAVSQIRAGARRGSGAVTLRFDLEGRLDRLAIPAFSGPERADGLWRHTCFEVFLRRPGEPGYLELNLAPSGRWAAYRFEDYRHGLCNLELARAPAATVRRTHRRLELDFLFGPLPSPWSFPGILRLALCAVVEAADGSLSYWALAHPTDRPDFHHPESAILEVGGT